MTLSPQISADMELMLSDWQRPVTYRVVSAERDVAQQRLTETFTDVELQGMVGPVVHEADRRTAGQASNPELEVLVRESDLPADAPQLTDRVVMDGDEYQLRDFQPDARTGLVSLTVVRR
ncbi:hypothetical protein [Rubinisphaera brasiliensis]|uniref:Uncharacterized protein n=1 Tax=Rubinisphaera brasiliensis (strain ATCC 49424 / DSM 5305 / JCM 21570 / IAM 15109 / NBRC 103401 / IFAM 1448) TaxID=756272 RepID=F0SKQ8_RUBBR|nr:hypothetical protein [Rubinisphaera brasiliensis]ADY58728.1 hypothetical protein Plabr_1110 [Rubinisphaera brasiliensis DSM 5305]